MVTDASAVMWTLQWLKRGKIKYFIDSFKAYLLNLLKLHNVYLVLDRYRDYSTKGQTRTARTSSSRVDQLSLNTDLPTKEGLLTVTKNKLQPNQLILENICSDERFLNIATKHHKLVLTGDDDIPIAINHGT